MTRIAVLAASVLLMTAVEASAQIPWSDRVFANLSGGGQSGTQTVDVSFKPTIYDEPATVAVTRDVKGGGFWDLTVGAKVRGNFGAAFSLSGRSAGSDGALTASIPDPVAFDRPRAVSATVTDLVHKERWVGLLGVWFVPVAEKIDLMIMAGPAVTSVQHELPTSVAITEEASGPRVTVGRETFKKSLWGYHLAADIRYLVTPSVGVGGFLRKVGATGDIGSVTDLEVGGVQVGVGVRIRY